MKTTDNLPIPLKIQFTTNEAGGKKHTGGKWDPTLVSGEFYKALSEHMHKNGPAGKYGRNNWTKGMTAEQCLSAAERHHWRLKAGEDIDPETGTHHAVCIAANMMMYYACLQAGKLKDDRAEFYPDLAARK